jgi:hypothetical protein
MVATPTTYPGTQNVIPPVVTEPQKSTWRRVNDWLLNFGSNVDENMRFGRLKDLSRFLDFVADSAASITLYARFQGGIDGRDKQKMADYDRIAVKWRLGTNLVNTLLQSGILGVGISLDKIYATRVFEGLIREEGIVTKDQKVNFSDLHKSSNPLVKIAAGRFARKNFARILPLASGLLPIIPEATRHMSNLDEHGFKANSGPYKYTKWIEMLPGSNTLLGFIAMYFGYSLTRQPDSFHQFQHIWNKTEGVLNVDNRIINKGIKPGEMVTSQDITALYDVVSKELNLTPFTIRDALSSRLFEQVARYLNHHYIPELFEVQRPDLHDKERKGDLIGTSFDMAKLVEFMGKGGMDIDDSLETAAKLEVISRKGIAEFHKVSKQFEKLRRPHPENYTPSEFKARIKDYMKDVHTVAVNALGEAWPPYYVTNSISNKLSVAYLGEELAKELGDEIINISLGKQKSEPTARKPYLEESSAVTGRSSSFKARVGNGELPPAQYTDKLTPQQDSAEQYVAR